MKKAVMVIAQEQFKDEELFLPKKILEDGGIEVLVASLTVNPARSVEGKIIRPDLALKDINPGEFDALVFIGGAGATLYWNDPAAHKLVREAYDSGKIVAAICVAPVTLAKAGVLKGKRATVWASDSGQLLVAGARYARGENVVKDGTIITAAGPFAAGEFGEELLKALI